MCPRAEGAIGARRERRRRCRRRSARPACSVCSCRALVVPGCIGCTPTLGRRRFDAAITDAVVSLRVGWLDAPARTTDATASRYGLGILMLLTIAGVARFKRWRHLTMLLIGVALSGLVAQGLLLLASRPRPFDVTIIGSWEGYSAPSLPMGGLAVVIVGIVYMLVVPGRPRMYAKCVGATVLILAALLRIYLGIDGFTDALFGILVGVSIPVALFRAFVHNEVSRCSTGRHGKWRTSTSRAGEAKRSRGDAGAARLRRLEHEAGRPRRLGRLDAPEDAGGRRRGRRAVGLRELYAKNHVRADPLVQAGRTMLYGRLRTRLLQHGPALRGIRDYTLRLLGEKGFSPPRHSTSSRSRPSAST